MNWTRPLLREPLFHFGLLALLIFAINYAVSARTDQPDEGQIVVSAARIDHMATVFERTWLRPPTEAELQALIDDYVIEEIFVRDAIALGLDQDDTVIRRRLRQKMEFLDDPMVDALEPSDADLAAYLADHPDRFALDPRLSFEQVFLSPDKRGDAVMADADALLVALKSGAVAPSDPSLLPEAMTSASLSDIGNIFGADFAKTVVQSPEGAWTGPMTSAFGVHLIRVTRMEAGRLPSLDEVRPAVEREWINARAAELVAARLATMRERYEVRIERPGSAAGPSP